MTATEPPPGTEPDLRGRAEAVLADLAGSRARLRDDQWTAIQALVARRARALVVQRTGWGWQLLRVEHVRECSGELEEVGAQEDVHPITAYRWLRDGKPPVPARRSGRLIPVEPPAQTAPAGQTVAYPQVSSVDRRADPDRQLARMTTWATTHGPSVDRAVTEAGSAPNRRRRTFLARCATRTSPGSGEHGDRFVRCGAEHAKPPVPGKAVTRWSTPPRSMTTWSAT